MKTTPTFAVRRLRALGLGTVGTMALVMAAQPAFAAEDQPAATAAATEAPAEAIVVTGSRIARSGYDAPTPVNIVSEAELQAEPQPSIGDYVNTLPAVQNSASSQSNSGSLSNGQSGIATVNLRNLDAQRTLILINGQRSVSSSTAGLVDVQTIPQGLIKGVEVVTGGASSVYGSDAVAGVVNFILNTDFDGFKAEYEHGVTTYGDAPNHLVRLTAGQGFAGGRGRILLAGDYFKQEPVDTIDRDWNDAGFFQITNPDKSPGAPERFVGSGIGTHQFTPGGIVRSGPLAGTYFGRPDGNGQASLNQFSFGPTDGQWMQGGDYLVSREGHHSSNSLVADEERYNIFGRVSYEVSPAFEIYAQGSFSSYENASFYQKTPTTSVTIQRDNAYLPTEFGDLMDQNGLTSVSVGTGNWAIPAQGANNRRQVQRYVIGADGDFDTGGISWSYNAYYQLGIAKTRELLTNTWRNANLALATDAVFAPDGSIVCRSTLTDPGNGCLPVPRIGFGEASPDALNYIFNGDQPTSRRQRLRQDVAAVTFSTNDIWDNWAGPVSLAFGAEYRREAVDGEVTPAEPNSTGFLYGNYRVTRGDYEVLEGFVETIFPVYEGLDLNGALRVTDYSTSGTVTTWKLGATWQVIDDIKLRVTRSRDIRAPNLAELFDPGRGRTNTVDVPLAGGGFRADQFFEQFTGTTDLDPEVALTWGIGAVFTPTFLDGFAASVDYFDIDLSGAISNITAQTTVDQCFEQNNQAACALITFASPNDISQIRLVPFNFSSIRTKGIDFEASYRKPIGDGNMTLRAVASHYIDSITDNGINTPQDEAGQNSGGGVPSWNFRLSANYDTEDWAFNVVGRGFSGGVYDNRFIECQSNCPEIGSPERPNADFRTINNNRIDGQWYVDTSITRRFDVGRSRAEVFLYVRNLFNSDPVPVGIGPTGNNTPGYPQTNRVLYDVLGRQFRLGVRFEY